MHRRITALALGLATLACDAPADPAGPAEDFGASLTSVIASATGSAHRIRNGELWVLSFNASKRADGRVTGQARMDRKDAEVSINIRVTCMSVVGNTAWIGGIIDNQAGDIAVDGTVSYFYVIDNGEGDGAPADIASAVRLNDVEDEDLRCCEEQPLLLPASPIEHGNVQVRGD